MRWLRSTRPLAYCYSWVMLDERKGFVPLPRERILFTSPPRTALALQTPNSYPGKTPISINSPGGVAYLTNQRVSNDQGIRYPNESLIILVRAASLLTHRFHASTSIIFRSHTQSPRHSCFSAILWPECLDRYFTARDRWRHSTPPRFRRNQNDLQGRRSIRFPLQL